MKCSTRARFSRRLASRLLPAVLACVTSDTWAGVVLYQTSFESPEYAAGSALVGQQGWTSAFDFSDAMPQIVTAQASEGSQAVRIRGADFDIDSDLAYGIYRRAPYELDTVAAGYPVLRVGVDARLDGPQTFPPIDGEPTDGDLTSANLSVLAGPEDGLCGFLLTLSSDGHVWANACGVGGWYAAGTPVTLASYHRLEIELDFQGRSSTFYVDGSELATIGFRDDFTSNEFYGTSLQFVGFPPGPGISPADYTPANYTAYFDRLSIVASVPQPGSFSLFALALGMLALTGRAPRRVRRG